MTEWTLLLYIYQHQTVQKHPSISEEYSPNKVSSSPQREEED